jgi:4-diphosphocytidyl-2C-methyl-D-erythritol kinase
MYIEVLTKNKHGLEVGAKVSLSTHAARTMIAEGTGKLISHAEFSNHNVSLAKNSKAVSAANMSNKEDKETSGEETKIPQETKGTPEAKTPANEKAGKKEKK